MKKFPGLLFLVLALATSCSSQSSSESGVETTDVALPGTMDNDDASGASLADSDWADTREIELELAWGGNISIQVSIGEVTTLTNPDSQIDDDCALGDLPPVGTSFQRIEVTVKSNSSRDIAHPKVSLGSLGRTENSLIPEEFFELRVSDDNTILFGGHPPDLGCVLKEDKGTLFGVGRGFFEEFMNPGEVESFQTILTIKPGAPAYWRWALLVTAREDETGGFGIVNPDGMSPGALIFDLHDFNSDLLPELKSAYSGPNLVEQICSALNDLDVPSKEGRDSENLKTLSRWSELSDSELSSLVIDVINAYNNYPDEESRPFSHMFARQRCEALGF